MNELRINATYRYEINLQTKSIAFFEERFFYKTDVFRRGANPTRRYTDYLLAIEDKNL